MITPIERAIEMYIEYAKHHGPDPEMDKLFKCIDLSAIHHQLKIQEEIKEMYQVKIDETLSDFLNK